MRVAYAVLVSLLVIFLSSCKKDKDEIRPGVRFESPEAYSDHLVGDTIVIIVKASDDMGLDRVTIDLVNESVRVMNKVRPLVKDDGYLVSINNALFLSGADYIKSLEELCKDGYLTIQELIPVPQDITGFPETAVNHLPSDPAPFNHSTKIVILRVKRK